jgi:hypothetical protein
VFSSARLLCLILLWCVALAAPLAADATLRDARQAQLLLGPGVWSRLIRVENSERPSRYPRQFHALVFEFAGLLWFYMSGEGTQSFSLHRDNLEAEKRDFAPLLRDIAPGLGRWREVEAPRGSVEPGASLPNGCWIESVVALRERLAAGETLRRPRLLSYYYDRASGGGGHTVLAFEQDGRLVVHDPARPDRSWKLPLALGPDPLAVARNVDGPHVRRARELWLDPVLVAPAAPGATVADERSPGAGRGAR